MYHCTWVSVSSHVIAVPALRSQGLPHFRWHRWCGSSIPPLRFQAAHLLPPLGRCGEALEVLSRPCETRVMSQDKLGVDKCSDLGLQSLQRLHVMPFDLSCSSKRNSC